MAISKDEPSIALPYNADMTILGKILNDLKTGGKEGVKLETLWANIGEANNKKRSYTMGLAIFLELADTDRSKIWLTDFGSMLRYLNKDERNQKLAQKLPNKYMTMFKWIHDQNDMRSNELKTKFIETWGNVRSSALLDGAIVTFLKYCNWIEVITYRGRGNQAKASITAFGNRVLDLPSGEIPSKEKNPNTAKSLEAKLLQDTVYPITIKTKDRGDFDWDIKVQEDWAVVDSVIASIKKGWEETHKQKPS